MNACTESTTPERVRNVPRIVRQNVAITSDRFQTRSIPRRSCTITEWMNAVAVSHGSNDAFSTGSQRPEAAPAEHLVAPPRAEDDADGEEAPGDERRAAGVGQPALAEAAGDERGDART